MAGLVCKRTARRVFVREAPQWLAISVAVAVEFSELISAALLNNAESGHSI